MEEEEEEEEESERLLRGVGSTAPLRQLRWDRTIGAAFIFDSVGEIGGFPTAGHFASYSTCRRMRSRSIDTCRAPFVFLGSRTTNAELDRVGRDGGPTG